MMRIVYLAAVTALSVAILLFPGSSLADPFSGVVVGVSAGDAITVLDSSNHRHRVQIAGIDAPEMGQPFGDRSTRNLAGLVHSKEVKVECPKKEMVCKVWVQPADCPRCGKTLDVGYAQISVGLAWWNRAYAKEQSDEDRGRYESEEEDARLRKRGLWRDAQPIPPWQWRAERRKN